MVLTMIKKILIAAIYSVTISAYAFAENHFNIESFSDTTKSVPAVGNSFIIPVTSTTLQQITTPPEVLEKGHVLLRRRFSAREYGLYIGLMNPKAYNRLPSNHQKNFYFHLYQPQNLFFTNRQPRPGY